MPITFAAPEPNPAYTGYLSAVASSANRALPIVADLYGQAARNAQGIGVAGAQMQARMASENADRAQQAGLAMQGLQQREADRQLNREELAARSYPTARDAFLAQQQLALQSADLSQREVIRMQRLQQARGEVFAQLRAGRLDKDTAADLLTQITSGVSPLEARAQASRQRLIDQQTEEAVQQAQRASAVNQVNLDIAAGNYQKHLQRVPMGGGKFAVVGPDGKGGWIQLKDPADEGGAKPVSMKELESIASTRFDAYVKDQLKPDAFGERKLSPQDAEKKYHEILAGVVAQYGGGATPGQPTAPGQPAEGGERSPPGQPAAAGGDAGAFRQTVAAGLTDLLTKLDRKEITPEKYKAMKFAARRATALAEKYGTTDPRKMGTVDGALFTYDVYRLAGKPVPAGSKSDAVLEGRATMPDPRAGDPADYFRQPIGPPAAPAAPVAPEPRGAARQLLDLYGG